MTQVLLAAFFVFAAFYVGVQCQRWRNIDYHKRWKEALSQIDRMLEEGDLPKAKELPREQVQVADANSFQAQGRVAISVSRRKMLQQMKTWDRRELEVDRAKRGLLPADDLAGMKTWDIREVLKARAKYGTDA